MNKIVAFVMLVVILVACTPTPAATTTPTQPPAAPAPTTVPPTAPPAAPTTPPPASVKPTLLTDKLGTAADLVPTDAEVAAAKAALSSGKIGLIPCTMGSEYHSTVANSAVARAKELGITAEIFDPQAKAEQQISAIENFVSAGAKVIVICVVDPNVVKSAIQAAADAGVFIVQTSGRESAINGIGISIEDADLGCANGELAADAINKQFGGKATVAILDYPDLPNVVIRADNIEKCLKKNAPDAVIVGRFKGGTTDFGQTSMENALQAHPEIDVVASINDAGAYGAMTALQAAKKDPAKTVIVGIDAEAHAKDLIKAGGMYYGTIDTNPAATGTMAINAAVKLLAGATLEKNIKVDVVKITKETLK
ncbi:MAG TPA: sugar ABC transporter substrate-binding protein [Anaerolineaceae bacterium]|nr:sugar ABC transporter substrate-binding protein [Anaerolineaceae bacterium]